MATNYQTQPVSFGKYLLLEKIGSGGMAEIYRAKSFGAHGFVKDFAIKKLLPNLGGDDDFVSMFIDEAKIVVSLQHANIIQVLDLGELGQQCYIAMEFVHGVDLHDLLSRCAGRKLRLPLKLVLFVMMETLKGLDYAHRAKDRKGDNLNIVHCDVSPSNVLLSYTGDVKVGDFGVARAAIAGRNSQSETLKGKIGYMSPEQITGEAFDHRADVFACGVILYEALSLSRLFRGDNDLEVMLKIRDGDIQEELDGLKSLPSGLRRIVKKSLETKPDERYASAADFLNDLLTFTYKSELRVTDQHLSRFLTRVFADRYRRTNLMHRNDPVDPGAFPDLLSPQVARYRFREPNGNIVGPMSLETLVSVLRYRMGEGNAVSTDYNPWVPPSEVPEVVNALKVAARPAAQTGQPQSNFAYIETTDVEPAFSPRVESGPRIVLSRRMRDDPTSTLPPPTRDGLELEGSLLHLPFASLLYRLYVLRINGSLLVEFASTRKEVTIDNGYPGYVASNKSTELLGNFLCEHDVITTDQLRVALDMMSEFGGRLGDVLTSERLLTRSELFHYLSLQVREKLLEVFTWTDGTFHFREDRVDDSESYPLGIDPLEIIVEGIRTRMPAACVEATFAGRIEQPLRVAPNPTVGLDRLKLNVKELGIAAVIRDGDTIDDLLRTFATGRQVLRSDVMRLLFILHATKNLHFHVPRPKGV